MIGKRGEMLREAALRRPQIIRTGDQIAVDRPGSGLVERIAQFRGAGAGQTEADRYVTTAVGDLGSDQRDQLLQFVDAEHHAFARRGREDEAVDRAAGVVSHQPAQRCFVEFAVAERRDQRQPKALQLRSKVSHGPSPWGEPETGQ